MKFRKKPVVVDATQWHKDGDHFAVVFENDRWGIHTLEGFMGVTVGDWIITGIHNEHYACKPDIFVKTYDEI